MGFYTGFSGSIFSSLSPKYNKTNQMTGRRKEIDKTRNVFLEHKTDTKTFVLEWIFYK